MAETTSASGRFDGELPPGADFASYRIGRRLGAGGMSVLYEANEVALDRPIALKVMAAALSLDTTFRDRFVGEARAASAIEHPNVIPIFSAGEVEGRLYIAMRLVPGGFDLRKRLRQDGRLTPDRAAALLAQAAAALDACHARGLVHRDVKPDNLLLSPDEAEPGVPHLYLTDFGLTRAPAQARLTRAGQVLGTLAYAAPEQIRGEEVDGRADVYALGATLYECVAGRRPFVRSNDAALMYAQINDEPPSAREHCPDLPTAVDAVFGRALAKDPADRFRSCGDLLLAFAGTTGSAIPRLLDTGPTASGAFEDAPTIIRGAGAPVDEDAVTRPRPVEADGMASTVGAPTSEKPRRTWALRVGAGVLVLVVLAGAAVVVARRGDGAVHLPRLTSANGLTVDRSWRLTGNDGDRFEGSTEIANPTDHQVTYTHDEVFPKSLAADAALVQADPPADRVVVADPVLRWKRDVPPHGTLVFRFTITVAAEGVSDDRIRSWVDDRRHTESAYAKTDAARESDTPFETDDGVETAAGPGTAGGSTALEDTTVATDPDAGSEGSTPSREGTGGTSATPPTISTTQPPVSKSTSSTKYSPPTVTNPPVKDSYSPSSAPGPTGDEQIIIDRVNELRAGRGRAALTADGRLTGPAHDRATQNAAAGTVSALTIPQIAPNQRVQVWVQRGSSLDDAWATSVRAVNFGDGVALGTYQYIGVGVGYGSDGTVYLAIAFMLVP